MREGVGTVYAGGSTFGLRYNPIAKLNSPFHLSGALVKTELLVTTLVASDSEESSGISTAAPPSLSLENWGSGTSSVAAP